jgi:hypothetical protein
MSITKLTSRENLTKYASWLGLVGPPDKENLVKMYTKYCFIEMVRIRIRIKQSDLDPYQIEKQDPAPYQKGLDPQHWFISTHLNVHVQILSVYSTHAVNTAQFLSPFKNRTVNYALF